MRLYEDVDRGRQLIKSGRGAVYGVWIIDDLRYVPKTCPILLLSLFIFRSRLYILFSLYTQASLFPVHHSQSIAL